MCMTVTFSNGKTCELVEDILSVIDISCLVLNPHYKKIDTQSCMCQLDIEATLKKSGYDYTCDGMGYLATKTTVKSIVENYLVTHGFDGLYNPEGECACVIGDLQPCCEDNSECLPGTKKKCENECAEFEYCIGRPGAACRFYDLRAESTTTQAVSLVKHENKPESVKKKKEGVL